MHTKRVCDVRPSLALILAVALVRFRLARFSPSTQQTALFCPPRAQTACFSSSSTQTTLLSRHRQHSISACSHRTALLWPIARIHTPTLAHRSFHSYRPLSFAASSSGSSSSSSSSSSSWKRSQSLDAHFVRFRISRTRAEEIYLGWAARQPFAPASLTDLRNILRTDVAYLPFYVFDVQVASRFSGRVGHRVESTRFNPVSKRMESYTTTEWRTVPPLPGVYTAAYTPDLPQLQIYGAFKLKWEPIQVLKTPLSQVAVLPPSQMRPDDFGRGQEVDVFEMKLATAQGRVKDFIHQSETAKGERLLRERYQADEAQVTADVAITSFRIRRVYHPAFVFHLRHLGQDFEVLVNGSTGEVWGQYIYAPEKVGAAAALAGTATYLVGCAAHLWHLSPTAYILGVLLPAVVAAVAGKYWASVRQFLREARRVGDREADASLKADEAGWTTAAGEGEQRRTEQRYEEQYRQYGGQQQQQQQQQQQSPRAAPQAAAKSYYDLLGLRSDATLDDIRTAFRAKSFQYHPDVNRGKEREANDMFRDILEAYQTLRDPKKRATYDQQMQASRRR